MGSAGNHCSFVLLAEFHIFEGAQLKYQFPQPLGIDESVLAMSMLPDGAETQLDDWTVFFLNQQKFNTIAPVLALDTPETNPVGLPDEDEKEGGTSKELLCVLNLVRTKHDKALVRGAQVLALAICTRHPFIQIFKPFLLMALDDYFLDPSQDCLARLFDAVNSMDLSGAPKLTRYEKMVMRSSERKDIFVEKFSHLHNQNGQYAGLPSAKPIIQHRSTNSGESYSSFEEGLLLRSKERNPGEDRDTFRGRERADTESTTATAVSSQSHGHDSPSEASFSLGGSAVWVGDESGLDLGVVKDAGGDAGSVSSTSGTNTLAGSSRKRRSTDASSSSSHAASREQHKAPHAGHHPDHHPRPGLTKDTHFYHAVVPYKDHNLPIKMPLSTFAEEVGDYSLITLVKVFSSHQQVSGPVHPHLHTSGPQTHPIIILFNALITGKRIIFLGHKRPAGEVSGFVLAACALASGCGAVLRGFIERTFPYANLNNREEWEAVPAYIAGVTNPIFESIGAWDLLLDIGSGTVTVSKDIHTNHPPLHNIDVKPKLITRTGTLKAEASVGSEDEIGRALNAAKENVKSDSGAKMDNNADRTFIEDIRTAIEDHFGESLVRLRFTEYVMRFVRLASRYEEETTGTTQIGYLSMPFVEGLPGRPGQLGSGLVFSDEIVGIRELNANAARIDAWRRSHSYDYFKKDFGKQLSNNAIRGFDVFHQLFRFRLTKNLPDAEVLSISRALADNVKTYEQAVELLSYLMPQTGGLMHLGFGLFHQREAVREATVDLFNQLRMYSVGVVFLQALNHFQRYAYVRMAVAREKRVQYETLQDQQQRQAPPPQQHAPSSSYSQPPYGRVHSNSVATSHNIYLGKRSNGAF
ncbi:mesa protein [Pluteus cervinus]|uniref:Mesa protein n=1 Tax=Pluteus cervinus TaxID=181527 RepID=A0ACD3B9B4_9AGAR|nr:mesa protein [Pluteus cervinus]